MLTKIEILNPIKITNRKILQVRASTPFPGNFLRSVDGFENI